MYHKSSVFSVLVSLLILSGCGDDGALSQKELAALENPPKEVQGHVIRILPKMAAWQSEIENLLVFSGRPLTANENAIARKIGVSNTNQVRISILQNFPEPQDPELKSLSDKYGISAGYPTVSRSHGYVILLKPEAADDIGALVTEFVHIAKSEKLGRQVYLTRYLTELEIAGYKRAPIVVGARSIGDAFRAEEEAGAIQ